MKYDVDAPPRIPIATSSNIPVASTSGTLSPHSQSSYVLNDVKLCNRDPLQFVGQLENSSQSYVFFLNFRRCADVVTAYKNYKWIGVHRSESNLGSDPTLAQTTTNLLWQTRKRGNKRTKHHNVSKTTILCFPPKKFPYAVLPRLCSSRVRLCLCSFPILTLKKMLLHMCSARLRLCFRPCINIVVPQFLPKIKPVLSLPLYFLTLLSKKRTVRLAYRTTQAGAKRGSSCINDQFFRKL